MVRNGSYSKMETTFYEEQPFRRPTSGEVDRMKRSMTLELNGRGTGPGKIKLESAVPVLSSPDLNKLKVSTPELEELIIGHHGLVTATPTSTQILFPKNVTEEQEIYARGFEAALNELHHSDSSQGAPSLGESSKRPTYTSLMTKCPSGPASMSSLGLIVKDEPQTVPDLSSSPPLSPIDLEYQEKMKLERKRMRNRVAASKCRRRKLERITRLEDKVNNLKKENAELAAYMNTLKEEVYSLKEEVMNHVQLGCKMPTTLGPIPAYS